MTTNLKPLSDRIVIKRGSIVDKTEGGIIIPDAQRKRKFRGVVLAIGPGAQLESGAWMTMTVKVGDTVIFPEFAGNKIKGTDDHWILRESDCFGILEGV